jgi:transposase-like protein
MENPSGGRDYPRSMDEFLAWFRTDAQCLDYLDWLRWPDGFVCPRCHHRDCWKRSDGRTECRSCGSRTSVTAGTIFDRTRTPLTVWFMAFWLFATGKDGISALSLKRTLSVGSYQTTWAALHRLRSALVRPGRERLSGVVQVDETFIGGVEPGLPGGRARGKKALVAIAVEMRGGDRLGRCRMQVVPDASAETLQAFVKDHVEPGSTVVTDGWPSYPGLVKLGYKHEARNQSAARARGKDPGELLKGVHRIASLAKRWLLGTHQGAVENSHLPAYLNEFVFRFNRRNSRSRGMLFFRALQLAVMHEPVRYDDLIVERRPRKVPPKAPVRRGHPPSLDRPTADCPWRRADA